MLVDHEKHTQTLINHNLDTILTGGPGDLDLVTLGDDLTAKDLAGHQGTREESVGRGGGSGPDLPHGLAAGDDVDGADVLVPQVARGPGGGAGRGGREAREQLGLERTRGVRARGLEAERHPAPVLRVLRGDGEGDDGRRVGAAVGVRPGHKAASRVEVDRARRHVVLGSVLGIDGRDRRPGRRVSRV